MAQQDPEHNETRALHRLADFTGRNVLEIGCGEGRLTWRYAEKAAQVTAIDAYEESIRQARAKRPAHLASKVVFRHGLFADFARSAEKAAFDIVILAWSL